MIRVLMLGALLLSGCGMSVKNYTKKAPEAICSAFERCDPDFSRLADTCREVGPPRFIVWEDRDVIPPNPKVVVSPEPGVICDYDPILAAKCVKSMKKSDQCFDITFFDMSIPVGPIECATVVTNCRWASETQR